MEKVFGEVEYKKNMFSFENRIYNLSTFDDFRTRHENFPLPFEDKLSMTSDHFCAFKSIEQFQEWVSISEIKEIIAMGFKVLLIDVSECLVGGYQIIYKKEHILQTKDISNLFI